MTEKWNKTTNVERVLVAVVVAVLDIKKRVCTAADGVGEGKNESGLVRCCFAKNRGACSAKWIQLVNLTW